MTEMTCSEVEEAATEYALGLLPPDETRSVHGHLLGCSACRQEVADIRQIGDQLLELIPDAEPPLGFDRRVLAAVAPHRARRSPKLRLGLLAAAAAFLIALAGLGVAGLAAHHHGPGTAQPAELAGTFHQDGHQVGTVDIGGHPTWVYMTVNHLSGGGSVSCQLVANGGTVTTIGSFQLVDGSGSWGAPETAAISHPTSVKLVSSTGAVLATAALTPS
jgi:hypothetical protein